MSSTAVFVNGVAVCLASGTNCPAASGLDTLQSVTARGSFTTTTAQFFGGFVAASSSVTGTFAVAGTSTLLRDVYVGTSTYDVFLNSDFVLDGNDLFAADNIGSVSSIFSNGMLVTGETGPTLFGDGFINQTDGALVISANSSFLTQPSISIIAGDVTSGLAGDVNILAGNGLGGNPAGNIYLTPGDSLGQPGHLYLNAAGTSNQPQFRFESIGGGMVSLEAPNTANTENFVLPFADGASSTVIGTNGTGILTFVSVCLTDGTNCPASSGLDTLQSVTARGSFTTTTAQFFGGFVAASSSVTGTFVVVGSTSLRNVDFTTATGTSVTTTNLFATLGGFTTATATNANINILTAATGTVSSLNFRNATGTFLFASTGTFATVTSSFLYANTANFATATVSGVGICLSNGVGCPAAGSVAVSLDSAYDGPSGSGSGRTIFADNGAVNIIVPTTGTSPGLVINHQEDSSFVNAVEIYSTGTNLALFVQRNNSNFDTNSARFINTNPGGSSITVESSDTYLSFLANRTLSGGTSVISSLSSTGVAQGLNFNARSFDFRTAPDGITQFSALSMLQSGATTFNTSSTESATAWKVNNFGSGPSLEVFDGGNALSDNTSFMIDDNGDVGIGLNPGEVKLSVLSSRATTTAVARFSSTSSADFDLFVATGTPEGNTSGSPGDLAVDTRDGRLFVKTTGGSTGWLSVCLSDGTNCPAASGLDTLQSVTARGSFTTTTAQFFGGFVAASSSVTGTFAVAGTSTLLRDVYVGTSTYDVFLNSDFVLDGNDLFAADNIGSVSSIFSNGMLVTGETGPTLFGDGFINQTDGALVISANSSFLTQPSISIIAGDVTSGLAGDVNILAGNGLGGNPAGNIYLTPGDSLGQPGHLYLNAAGTSNQPQFRFESIGGGMVSLEAPNTANTENFVLPFADGASSTVIGTNGTGILTFVSVCLTDGTNCPASSGLDTLQSVTARGSFTTTTAQFFGGFVAASSSVTGTFVVVGSTSLRNVDFTTATGTSVTTTNLFAALGSFTTATATNANINILSAATGTVSNLNFRNATGTFLFASTGTFATVTSSFLYANTANFATATVSGVGICLSNGVGCPASGSSNDTLLTITNRGAIATSTFTLYGGFVAASSSVTGTLNVVGSLNVFGGTSSRIAFEAPLEQYVTATTPFTTMATTYVGNDPRVVVVQGNYAYIMSNTPQLHIVDVSNPSAPILMSTTTLSGGSSWSDLVVSGDYVYTVDFGGTMNVVDVSNPRRPLVTDTLSLSGPGEIEVAGRYAYVAEWSSSRIAVIDISDPYNISVLSQTASDLEAWGMEVQGDYVYTSAYGSGPFNVYNVSDPNTVRRVGTTGALSSLSNEVPLRVQGSYAYLGSAASNYFYVIDISNATGPTVIFQGAVTSTSISNYKYFSVNGDYVYVSEDGTGEMHVIDISNPRYPRYVKTHTYSPTTNFGIDVAGRYAYVLHQGASDSMSIIKVGGSETNALLAHSFEAGTLNVLGIADFQNFVSIRTGLSVGSAGINSFGSLNVYATNTTSTFYGAVSTSRLMVGGYAVCLSNGTNCPAASGLDTLQSVTARGSFTTTTAQFFGGFVAASSSVTGTFRVIGSSIVNGTSTVTGSSSFNGVDFVRATGTSVTTTNLFATNALFTGATGTTVTSSQVFWNNATGARLFVYGATFNDATSSNFFVNTMLGFTSATGVSLNVNGFTAATASIAGLNFRNATGVNLFTTNVTTTNLSVLGTFSATNLAWTNATGTFLTVTTSTQTFSSIRYVSSSQLNVNTAVLMRMGQASSVGSPTEVFVSGRYAYVNSAAFADINIYDISDPNAPTSVSSIQMPGGNSGNAYVVGDYLYTGDQGTQLRIYDISNRRDPRLVSQLTGPTCEDCIVSGRYLYSVDTNSFDIVDITNATAPRRVFSTTTSNGEKVRVQGSYAYAILGGNSVRVFDVTNATSPIQIASIALTSPSALAVSGRFLYVNNSTAVRVYDIADPNNPTLLGSVAIGNTPGEIDVAGKYLYITHNDLSVVDVSSSTNPRIVIQDLSLGSNGIDVYGRYGVVGISGGIQIIDFGGLETHAARIGALEVGSITGWNDADFGGTLRVGTSLQVGRQGIFTFGSLAVGATNTTSTIEYAVSSTRGEFTAGLSVGGVAVCLSNGTNCPSSGSETLLTVSNRGAIATSTLTLYGGFVAASSSVTGTLNVIGSLNVLGGASRNAVFEVPIEQYVTATTPFTTMSTSTLGDDPNKVIVQGNYAYILASIGTPRLLIADVTNPSVVQNISTTTLTGGSSWADLAVSGDYAYTVDYAGNFNVINVSNRKTPRQVANINTLSGPGEVEVVGSYAYIAEWNASRITVIDISSSTNPVVAGQGPVDIQPWGIEIQGKYAYTIGYYASEPFSIYDVSSSTNPVRLASTAALSNLGGNGQDPLRVQGRYAYVGSSASNNFYVIDIVSSTNPIIVFQGAVTSTAISNFRGMSVNGDYAYVSEDGAGEMHVIDLSNPRYPRFMKTHTYAPHTSNKGIDVAGRYAYVLHDGSSDAMSVVRIGGTETNALLAHSMEVGTLNVLGAADFQNFVTIGTGLYVGNSGIRSEGDITVGGVKVCLADGTNCPGGSSAGSDTLQSVTARGSFTTTTVQLYGGFTASSGTVTSTLQVDGLLTFTTAWSPSGTIDVVGTTGTPNGAFEAVMQGKYVYTTTNSASNGLYVTDVSDPYKPRTVGHLSLFDDSNDLDVSGRYAYVVDSASNILTIDISNPARPFVAATTTLSAAAITDIDVVGPYLYELQVSSNFLDIYDISNPLDMRLVGRVDHGSIGADELRVVDGYAYIHTQVNGIEIIDVKDPSKPVIVDTLDYTANAFRGFDVSGAYLYALANDTLHILDISNPTNARVVSTSTGFSASGNGAVRIAGNTLYVGNDNNFHIVDVSSSTRPIVRNSGAVGTGSGIVSIIPSGRFVIVQAEELNVVDVGGIDVSGARIGGAYIGQAYIAENVTVGQNASIQGGLNVGMNGIMSLGAIGVMATNTTSTFWGTVSTTRLFVSGREVCLADGTSCSFSGGYGADVNWIYSASGDFMRTTTGSTDVIIGNTTIATAPFRFDVQTTSSRLIIGQNSNDQTRADLVIGATTSSGMNTAFQLTGDDLFVAGNIGSASSVYTNGAFIAGSGSTLYGDGYIARTTGDIVVSASSNVFRPSANNTLNLGSVTSSFRNIYASGTIAFGTASGSALNLVNPVFTLATSSNFTTFPTGVAVRNNIAYLADSNFVALDVSNPSNPTLISTLASVNASDLTLAGDYAYVAADGLKIIDISRPGRPVQVGYYANGLGSTKPVISGQYAYMGGQDFQIVDISSPTAPTSTAIVTLTGSVGGVDVQGKFAYVANDTTFRIYDITDPSNPTATGTLGGFNNLGTVIVSGQYAYVVNDGADVVSIDISNPAAPVSLDTYSPVISLQLNDITLSGRYLYLSKHVDGIEVLDITDPNGLIKIAEYNTPGAAFGMMISGKYLYVADFGSGLAILDLGGADISSAKIGSLEMGSGQVLNNLDIGGRLNVAGGILAGIEGVFSRGPLVGSSVIVGATSFATSSRTSLLGTTANLSVHNEVAVISQGFVTPELRLYDVSQPKNPTLLSSILASTAGSEVIIKGDYVYEVDTTIRAIDVSSPSYPVVVASTTLLAPYSAFISGPYLYAAQDAGLAIFDISDSQSIEYLDTAPLPNVGLVGSNQRNGLYVRERFAYVTDIGADNFHIVDIHDPYNATSVGYITGFSNPQEVVVSEGYAYVVESSSSELNVINISSSTGPFIARTISSVQAGPTDLALAGNYLFVGGSSGVTVFDVSSSTNPLQVATVRAGSVVDLQIEGKTLHVTTASNYLMYDIPGLVAPAMLVGSVQAGTGLIENDFTIGNQLYVGGGIHAGGSIMARGSISASDIDVSGFGSATAVRTVRVASQSVYAAGDYVYTTNDASTRVHQISIANPEFATNTAAGVLSSASGRDLFVAGGYLYVAQGTNGLAIFSTENATGVLRQISTTTGLGTAHEVFVSGRYAYIAALGTGVEVVDVGNPYTPVLKETFDGSGTNSSQGVYLQDRYLYVGDGADGLRILDASDPVDLRQIGILNTAGSAEKVFVSEGIAYVTDDTNGLVIVDVSNPASPRLLSTVPPISSGNISNVTKAGDYLYVTSDTGLGSVDNFRVFDVSSSTRPVLVWGFNGPGSPAGVDVKGRYAYVGDGELLHVIRLPGVDAPSANIGSLFTGQLNVAEGADIGSYLNVKTGLSVGNGGIQVQGPSTITGSSTDAILRVRNAYNSSTTPYTAWGILVDSIAVSPSFNVPPANRDSWSMYIDYSSSSNRGGLCVDDAITGGGCPISNIGGRSIMTDAGITANAFDLAERYSVSGTAEGGDLLVLETSTSTMVTKHSGTMYDPKLIGIVSLNPGFELGWFNPSSTDVAVALTGRVPTKISMNNGPVQIGDPLTSSDVPGYAMKATKPGMIIGHALQSASATGTAEVFVAVGYWAGSIFNTDGTVALQTDDLTIDAVSIASSTNIAVDSWGLSFRGAAWDEASSTVVTSSFTLLNDVITASSSMFTIQNTSGTSVFSIDEFGKATINGDLSIAGKLYPSARGTVQSEYYIFLDDMLGPTSTYMSTNADGWQSEGSYDLAERYVSEQPLIEGELVTVSSEGGLAIERASGNQKPFMGIVSTKPGFVLGKHSTSTYPVALAGRVPTKVSDANGPIAIGDQLTASADNAGIAVKATGAGYVVGMALEAYPGGDDDMIEVFVQPGWTNGDGSVMPSAPSSGGGSSAPAGVTTVKRGFGDIAAGGTKVTIEFDSIGAYPNIQVTQYAGVEGGWYLNNVTDHGFEIVLNQVQSHDVRFAWRVEPTQAGEQVYYSDNTHGAIDYLTGIGPGTGVGTTSSDPGTDPGTSSGTDPGTDPGSGSSTDPGTDPGSGSSTDPGAP